jgi:DNA adenine methylase
MKPLLVCKPVLKWPCGKARVLGELLPRLAAGRRLIEPFVGSGVVFLNTDYDRYLVGDANPDLIGLYRLLQESPEEVVAAARDLFRPENNQPCAYYFLRDEMNASEAGLRRTALFIYLNRHAFNGLCRVNAAGRFNVSFGKYAAPYFPEAELWGMATKLREVKLHLGDYEDLMLQAGPGDVVYCDPPYVPLSPTASFTAYSAGGFGHADQERLARAAERAAGFGATVVVSNHDTPTARALYAGADEVHAFEVSRSISARAETRGKAPELLAVFQAVEQPVELAMAA